MPKKKYTSGNINTKSDFHVEYTAYDTNNIKIDIYSKTISIHGKKLHAIIKKTLSDLKIRHGKLSVTDNGGQYFVLKARIESAIKLAHPNLKLNSLDKVKKYTLYKSKKDRFRRSRLYIPGNQAKLMLNAGIHMPDAIILDLEDSVARVEKNSARLIVRNALRTLDFFGAERMVRINQGKLGLKDLETIIPHNVHLILIPKVENAEQLINIDKKIKEISLNHKLKNKIFLMPILESASGILNSLEIAKASKNTVAIAIGLEDYTADIGVKRTNDGKESLFARSQVVNAARSVGIQAIDTVFSDVNDENGLRKSVKEARELGFDGKGCIHPRQIQPIHEEFAPNDQEMDTAKKIILAFDKAQSEGLGVVSLGSKMIDPPVVKRAQQTINLALQMNLISKNWKSQ